MGKIYTTDDKIITDGFPQIQIGDKLYRVDTRKSTFDKMQAAMEKSGGSEDKLIIEYALGKEAAKEVAAMDLPVSGVMNLILYIQAAIFDISFEEAKERFQQAGK